MQRTERTLRYAPFMRVPAYPTLSGFALAVASCQPGLPPIAPDVPAQPHPGQTAEPAVVATPEPQVMILAREPLPGEFPTPLTPPHPHGSPADFVRIEDPQAQRVPVACPGDCPTAFRSTGPAVDLAFRVTDGVLPQARASLVAVHPSLRSCFLSWVRTHPRVRAQISITARVEPDGSPGRMEVSVRGSADSELTTCMANRIRSMRFAAPGTPATLHLVVDLTTD